MVFGSSMAANGSGIPAFMDDFTVDGSKRMNAELHDSILCANNQPNASRGIGRQFIIQQNNNTAKTTTVLQGEGLKYSLLAGYIN